MDSMGMSIFVKIIQTKKRVSRHCPFVQSQKQSPAAGVVVVVLTNQSSGSSLKESKVGISISKVCLSPIECCQDLFEGKERKGKEKAREQ
jgi:hypothetical protein